MITTNTAELFVTPLATYQGLSIIYFGVSPLYLWNEEAKKAKLSFLKRNAELDGLIPATDGPYFALRASHAKQVYDAVVPLLDIHLLNSAEISKLQLNLIDGEYIFVTQSTASDDLIYDLVQETIGQLNCDQYEVSGCVPDNRHIMVAASDELKYEIILTNCHLPLNCLVSYLDWMHDKGLDSEGNNIYLTLMNMLSSENIDIDLHKKILLIGKEKQPIHYQ